MKNILKIDALNDCTCNLISSVNDGTARLFLVIDTDISLNPKLEIVDGNTVTITANEFTYELSSSLWTGGGNLQFRIVDDKHTGDYFTINKVSSYNSSLTLRQINNFVYKLGSYSVPMTNAELEAAVIELQNGKQDSLAKDNFSGNIDDLYGSKYAGVYWVNFSNVSGTLPSGMTSGYGVLEVIAGSDTSETIQKVYMYHSVNVIWYRMYVNSQWYTWTVHGGTGNIGNIATVQNTSNVSTTNNGWTKLTSITLPAAGTYIIFYQTKFNSSNAGIRYIQLTTTNSTSLGLARGCPSANAIQGNETTLQGSIAVSVAAATTYYLYAYQSSGAPLGASGFIRYIRIA